MIKLFGGKEKPNKASELEDALVQWQNALAKFDAADADEVRFMALEVEAAKQRYMYLMAKQRERSGVR